MDLLDSYYLRLGIFMVVIHNPLILVAVSSNIIIPA